MSTTYNVGATTIQPFHRVFDAVGGLRLASDTELEQGIVSRTQPANTPAQVVVLQAGMRYPMVAVGAIGVNSDVYRAANGRVSSTGTSKIGRAVTAATAAGDLLTVEVVAAGTVSGGTGGSSTGLEPGDVLVTGTGVTATDNAAVAAAVTTLNAQWPTTGKGRLAIAGGVAINSRHLFTAPIDILFLNGGYFIEDGGTSGTPDVGIVYNPQVTPMGLGGTAISSSVAAGADQFVTTLPLVNDDLVAVWADNDLTDVTPHAANFVYRPGEVLKISEAVLGASNTYRFHDFVDDPLTTSPKVCKLPVLRDITITNFRVVHKEGTNYNSDFLVFNFCDDVKIINGRFGAPGAGKLYFKYCYNATVSNCTFEDVNDRNVNATIGYGVGIVWSTHVKFIGCTFGSYRHAVTSGVQDVAGSGVTYGYGSCKGVIFSACSFSGNGTQETTSPFDHKGRSLLDTHTSGRRWKVSGCQFHIPSNTESNSAITIRARDFECHGNTFFGASSAKPILVFASGAIIKNNVFIGGWYNGVENQQYNPNVNNSRWVGNTFRDFAGPPILINVGTGHDVSFNDFSNCASSGSGSKPRACVAITGLASGGTVTIGRNIMPKTTNLYSVHQGTLTADNVIMHHNTVTGYGGCSIGLDRTLASSKAMERRYGKHNGFPGVMLVDRTAHGLTSASYGFPIDIAYTVWDDTALVPILGIHLENYDADTICLGSVGSLLDLATSKIAQTYSPSANGPRLWFDKSASGYKSAKPVDSLASHVLLCNAIVGSEFNSQIVHVSYASPASADRLLGEDNLGDQGGSFTIDLDALLSRRKKVRLTSNATITVTSTVKGPFTLILDPNGFTWSVVNATYVGSQPTLTNGVYTPVPMEYLGS